MCLYSHCRQQWPEDCSEDWPLSICGLSRFALLPGCCHPCLWCLWLHLVVTSWHKPTVIWHIKKKRVKASFVPSHHQSLSLIRAFTVNYHILELSLLPAMTCCSIKMHSCIYRVGRCKRSASSVRKMYFVTIRTDVLKRETAACAFADPSIIMQTWLRQSLNTFAHTLWLQCETGTRQWYCAQPAVQQILTCAKIDLYKSLSHIIIVFIHEIINM